MDPTAKQQAVEKLKQANNVLVGMSSNPSVDELSAALGLTLLLSKLGKHVTAVFSGNIPPAVKFLEPDKTFEKNINGLRDFIIALDKDKADKLRYKVENDVVKIFITPYKSALSKEDLRFEEGDFNVDAVVALGVGKREDLDNAIKAHGRILHDAAVVTVNAGSKSSNLGSLNWQDPAASSLCEMLVSISESFGSGLLDSQMATAFLTGIVAATERFSNNLTSPKVMTMAAQLMASGANQQLIANNLNFKPPNTTDVTETVQPKPAPPDNSELKLNHDKTSSPPPVDQDSNVLKEPKTPEDKPDNDKTLLQLESEISSLTEPKQEVAKPPLPSPPPPPVDAKVDSQPPPPAMPTPPIETEADKPPPTSPPFSPQTTDTKADDQAPPPPTPHQPLIGSVKGMGPHDGVGEDTMLGGTFNATTEQAHEDSEKEMLSGRNNTLLDHPGENSTQDVPGTGSYLSGKKHEPLQPLTTPESSEPANPPVLGQPPFANPPPTAPTPSPQEENAGSQTIDVNLARKEVEDAIDSQPFTPDNNPLSAINAQPLPTDDNVAGMQPPSININANGNLTPPLDPNTEQNLPPVMPPPGQQS